MDQQRLPVRATRAPGRHPLLLGAEWYRKTGRFDSPAIIALRFNQRVRPEGVIPHARVALEPHAWTAPAVKHASFELA